MKVLLNDKVEKLGRRGDIVEVKPGYYRNFLFPRNLAVVAGKAEMALAEKRREKMMQDKETMLENAKETMAKLEGLSVEISEKVTDKETLYAAVTKTEVIEAVEATAKMTLTDDMIEMAPIKEIGEHKVTVKVGAETVEITVVVVAKAD